MFCNSVMFGIGVMFRNFRNVRGEKEMSLELEEISQLQAEVRQLRAELKNLRALLEKRNAQLCSAVEERRKHRRVYVRRMGRISSWLSEFTRSAG